VWKRLGGIGAVVMITLGITVLDCIVTAVSSPPLGLGLPLLAVQICAVVTFLIWFYQARQNADWTDWPQRLSRPWAVWGWLVPVIFLWFPVRVMAGVWRASQEPADRDKPMVLVAMWWSCWLLAWFTGYRHTTTVTSSANSYSVTYFRGLELEGTLASKLFAAAAAALLLAIVRSVSTGKLGADAPSP
jgi:Domain of unknown function (DUF4328)